MSDNLLPNVYWHPALGLLRERDGVWWRQHEGFTSLRHDGLPNERPADAVELKPVAESKSRYDFDQPDWLTAAQPGRVSDSNLEPITESVMYRLADETHRHLCACDTYPRSCQNYSRDGLAAGFTGVEDTVRVLNELGRLRDE
jgi:hypothetical protein